MSENLKIIEIGKPYLKLVLPQVKCYASYLTDQPSGEHLESVFTLPNALRDPATDLVVCHPQQNAPWSLKWWLRQFTKRSFFQGRMPLVSLVAPQWLRCTRRVPVIVVDLEDTRFISPEDFYLLDRCVAWYKRELPVDQWQVFMRTGHYSVPTLRYRQQAINRERLAKLRPLSLGIRPGTEAYFPKEPAAKTSDVFFAGSGIGNSTVREQGLAAMQRLMEMGYRIDIPSQTINTIEFLHRASSAYLVWSPEGYGWDCFRHYEAAACWSVPLMNQPTIIRHQPFVHGQHAWYYQPDDDSLVQTVVTALSDKLNLIKMGHQAREHYLQYHTASAIKDYILKAAFAAR